MARPPERVSFSSANFAARRTKTSVPKIECSSTRVGLVGPAGPARHVNATTRPRPMAMRPLTRCTRVAVAGAMPGSVATSSNPAAIATWSPARAMTIVVRMTFHNKRFPLVRSLSLPMTSMASSRQGDLPLHVRMEGADVLERAVDDEAERLARVQETGVDRAALLGDGVRRDIAVVEGDLGSLAHAELRRLVGDLGHDDGAARRPGLLRRPGLFGRCGRAGLVLPRLARGDDRGRGDGKAD